MALHLSAVVIHHDIQGFHLDMHVLYNLVKLDPFVASFHLIAVEGFCGTAAKAK